MNELKISSILKLTEIKDFDDNWNLIKNITSIIDSSEGRKVIIHILDIWDNINPDAKNIWLDLVERAGFYPYYVEKINSSNISLDISLQTQIRTSFFKSEYLPNVYFHEQQKEIEKNLSTRKNVAVSAPTSFGKSLMIEEIVARKQFDNILIIQPTLALIDETRKKMKKYSDFYNLIVNTRQEPKEKNIFILTAERVLEFPNLPQIDFFIIDEFYKISNRRNDSRIDALNVALLRVMDLKPQALFLTPTVDSLSEKFREKYNIYFFKTDYALVNTNIIELRNKNGHLFKGNSKKRRLFKLLDSLTDPSIVYVKSPHEAYKLANEYLKHINLNKSVINNDLDIFEWMDKNISPNWQLKNLLQHGIGAHNGALPRHIVTSEIDLFNEGHLKVLFATVSLIEGVNTVAKNMIVYSQNKGRSPIDFFDFANISGRAGRMGHYFSGDVYLFNEELEPEQFIIDIPAIDQTEVSDEILINIPDNDVIDKSRKEELTETIDIELQNIIKKNLISVTGQKQLYYYILDNYSTLNYLKWSSIPSYENLWKTLYIGYNFLEQNKSISFAKNKAVLALKLVNTSLPKVISEQQQYYQKMNNKDPINKAIDHILKFQRNDASFKIPKILAVVESIQKYVFEKNGSLNYGDYSFFSSLIENEKIDERFQFLIDYGVPSSAIKKISKKIPNNIIGDGNITNYLKLNFKIIESVLISYEKNLIFKAIN